MDKHAAQKRLIANGPGYPPEEWPVIRAVLSAESDPAHPTLAQLARRNAELVPRLLKNNGLCGYALHACPSLKNAPEDVRAELARGAQYEFGACAQRKCAMLELDRLAAERGLRPIVIKGGANALRYYEKESLRPSRDIDVIMAGEDIERLFEGASPLAGESHEPHEWGRASVFQLAGYAVEAHQYLISPERWGGYRDLLADSEPVPGCAALRCPCASASLTIALLHFAHHFGLFAFDLLDMTRMVNARRVDLREAIALWEEKDLAGLVMPGLTLLDTIAPVISEQEWRSLFDAMPLRRRAEVAAGLRFLATRRFSKFRAEWFNSRFEPPSFAHRVAVRFFGSRKMTEQITGRRSRNPLFWFFHLLGLPLKRIFWAWK